MDRLIVTSSVYQQSAAPDNAREAIDPDNRLLLAHESQAHGRRDAARCDSLGQRHA